MAAKELQVKQKLIELFKLNLYNQDELGNRVLSLGDEKVKELAMQYKPYIMRLLKVMVAYKKAKMKLKGEEWNCHVINFMEINDFFKIVHDKLPEVKRTGKPYRMQLIINTTLPWVDSGHFNTVDISLTVDDNKKPHVNIILLDATNDTRLFPVIKEILKDMESAFITVYSTCDDIQKDTSSCYLYAFKIASGVAKQPDLHETVITQANSDREFKWETLPTPLLKMCQSFRYLSRVPGHDSKQINKKGETLVSYFDKHSAFFTTPSGNNLKINTAAYDLLKKYANEILPFIKNMSADELTNVIEAKNEFPLEIPLPTDCTPVYKQ